MNKKPASLIKWPFIERNIYIKWIESQAQSKETKRLRYIFPEQEADTGKKKKEIHRLIKI